MKGKWEITSSKNFLLSYCSWLVNRTYHIINGWTRRHTKHMLLCHGVPNFLGISCILAEFWHVGKTSGLLGAICLIYIHNANSAWGKPRITNVCNFILSSYPLEDALLEVSYKCIGIYFSKFQRHIYENIYCIQIFTSPVPQELDRRDCGRGNDYKTFIVVKYILWDSHNIRSDQTKIKVIY
jgi:hypothetical protein